MKCKSIFILIAIYCLSPIIAKPFLFNTVRSLPQIAARASESATSKSVNIINYRAEKLEVSTEENEKPVNNDTVSFDETLGSNNEDDSKNEATPSFIQKKINKILAKIRFFSYLVNPNNANDNSDNNTNITVSLDGQGREEIDDFDFESSNHSATRELQTIKKGGYKLIKPDAIFEIDKEKNAGYGLYKVTNAKVEDLVASGSTNEEQQHLEDGVGGLGVYFMELLGSFVGLIYGAAAHITNPTTPAITRAL